jgi:hypothetical protein
MRSSINFENEGDDESGGDKRETLSKPHDQETVSISFNTVNDNDFTAGKSIMMRQYY